MITRARASALLFGGAVLGSTRIVGVAQTAATLKILGSIVSRGLLDAIDPIYEKTSNHSVAVQYAGPTIATIAASEPFDVVIASVATIDTLIKQGLVQADSQALLGASVASLAYRSGTSRPDTTTLAALKSVLLNAKAISFSDPAAGGLSAGFFAGLVQQLGITEDVQRKAIPAKVGEGAVAVGDGRADIGIAGTTEIALLPGVAGVPLSSSDPKAKTAFSVGVSTKSADPGAARAFVRFLLTADATANRKAKGFVLEP